MPSIVNGLFSARSGISSTGTAIAVIGDDISNAETTGYKSSRADFADLVAGGQANGKVIGSGSTISAVQSINTQGTLDFTNNPLDLAVDGNGFFVVQQGQQQFYTRAGDFKTDNSGNITTQDGLTVMGYGPTGSGSLQALNVNNISQSNISTNNVTITGNLDSSAGITLPANIPPAPASNSASSFATLNNAAQFSTTVNVFDSLGAKHAITYEFYHTQASPAQWSVHAYATQSEVSGTTGTQTYPVDLGSETVSFNASGAFTGATGTSGIFSGGTVTWANGATPQKFNSIDLSGFTGYSGSSHVDSDVQDGEGVGAVTSLSIGLDGKVQALLDNGQSATIGFVALANFSNSEGLARVGANRLQQSNDSGQPVIGTAQTGTLGSIQAGSVELSTVDIASEFVNLITIQRGFQANTQVITTINQLLNDIIQLA